MALLRTSRRSLSLLAVERGCVFLLKALFIVRSNFNPDCAKAGKFTIAEVEEVVPNGSLHPSEIHVPGVYVQAIVKANVEVCVCTHVCV